MVNDKYLYLIQLCMELQRGEDGRIEERMADEKPGPTAFAWFSGHTATLEIRIHLNGWDGNSYPDKSFTFYRSFEYEETLEQTFKECRDLLISLLREEGKDGVL